MSTTEPDHEQRVSTDVHGYLDAASTSPLRPEAKRAMLDALDMGAANPSSVHSFGHRAKVVVDDARSRVAVSLGALPSEMVFTAGGTEANNLAIIGIALANPRGKHIVTSQVEHPSVSETCDFLRRVHGFEITEVAVDHTGMIDVQAAIASLRDDTTLVTLGLANGEVGTVQPLIEVAQAAHDRGVPVHTDAVQAAPSLPVSFAVGGWPGEHVDAMTVASQKFGGPQGAGALLIRNHVALEPLLHGGGQERGLRSGTENVTAIAGFAAAVEVCMRQVGQRAIELSQSRDALISGVLGTLHDVELTGHPSERLPGHASFVMGAVSGESVLVALDAAGVAASSGSACAAGKDEPSPVLLAMGFSPEVAQTAVRFTLHEPLTDSLLKRIIEVMSAELASAQRSV